MSEKNNISHAQLSIFGLNSFHNSVPLKEGEELQAKEKKSFNLEGKILEYFKDHHYQSFTPHQIWLVFGEQWPLTSVRARITTLTKKGHLVMTGEWRPGLYGDPNNCWIYAKVKRSITI